MAFGHDSIYCGVCNGLLIAKPLHLGLAPGPFFAVHLSACEWDNDCDILPTLTLPVNATLELFEFGVRPGQDINDHPIADLLEPVHSGTDST